MTAEVYKKLECRLCGSGGLDCVVRLTPTPPGNHFVRREELGRVQTTYPLELDFCPACHHVQLGHIVHPDILYRTNYSYVSATSPVFVRHLKEYAEYVTRHYSIPSDRLVVDIGSNDGTALGFFQAAGYPVLGVDPATEVVAGANARGIPTVCEFFNLDVARRLERKHGKAALINSHNACAHIDALASVIQGAHHWLADDGLFVIEVGYLLDIIQNGWFDTVYHEHVDFHTLEPFVGFLSRLGFDVISAERISPQGGSIRIISQKAGGPRRPDGSVPALVAAERTAGMHLAETYRSFGVKIDQIGERLYKLIHELKAKGARIAGFGAPTKATTMLTHFRLGDCLDFLVEENPLKQNLYSPGLHIPVVGPDELYQRKPDYLLVLAWNFAENIMQRHRAYRTGGGRFMLPMPNAKICD